MMKYRVLTPAQQLEIVEKRLLNIEADYYIQDLENRLATALDDEAVKQGTASKRDLFGICIQELEDEIVKLEARIAAS